MVYNGADFANPLAEVGVDGLESKWIDMEVDLDGFLSGSAKGRQSSAPSNGIV